MPRSVKQNEPQTPASVWRRHPWHFACVAGVLACLCIQGAQTAQLVSLVLLTDGLFAAVVVVAATLGGTCISRVFRLEPLPWRWRILLGASLGLGALGILVLVLGTMGLLGRGLWWAILTVTAAIGLVHLLRLHQSEDHAKPIPCPVDKGRWMWMLLCPFVALILLVAVTPPGVLWSEEGFGYDVLEYHLQTPKEYWAAGQIDYLPHNVYANFPANAEMLYLLAMVLRGDPVDGAMSSKLINAAMALLTVAAAWLLGREHSVQAGRTAAIVCGSAGWLTYLSGVAYVENAMLLFGMMSLAALLRATRLRHDARLRWIAVGGTLAGFACGCKYTAILFIAVPFMILVALANWRSLRARLLATGIFALTVLIASAPWWVKNAVMTGDPVFPLAHSVFHAEPEGWGPQEADHFARSHQPEPVAKADGRDLASSNVTSIPMQRLQAYWERVHGDSSRRFGLVLLVLALGGLILAAGDRNVWLLLLVYIAQGVIWATTTHLYARFAVPMLLPLVALAARSASTRRSIPIGALHTAILTVGVIVNLVSMATLYRQHLYPDGQKLPVEGSTGWFTEGVHQAHRHLAVVNRELPPDAHILMVGDAKAFYFARAVDYTVVFNRNPFVETVRHATTEAEIVGWLIDQGYSHVFVHWMEIHRLRGSRYGFPDEITPDLFLRLGQAGLERTHVFTVTGSAADPAYGELYRVPRPAGDG